MSAVAHWLGRYAGTFESVQGLLVLACLALALTRPTLLATPFARLERGLASLAGRPWLSLATVAAAAIAARALILPLVGVPGPIFTDETSLLLQAQTYLTGHLANRQPLSPDFEAIYAISTPVYASIYPVLRALPLAAAGLLGLQPWFGVWASMILLAMAIYWALEAWIPPPYALVAALLVIVRYGMFSPLINSYFGSAFTALGGALVLGGYRRMVDRGRWRDGLAMGVGAFVLMTTRPFEGLVFTAPFAIGVVVHGLRAPQPRRAGMAAAALAAVAAVGAGFALIAADDYAVNGDWRVQPTALYRRTVAPTPVFLFQPQTVADHSRYDVTRTYFAAERIEWTRARSPHGLIAAQGARLLNKWKFYVGFALTIPFGIGLYGLRRRPLVWLALGGLMAGLSVVTWGLAHYAAPALALFMLVSLVGFRALRRWRPGDRPVGLALSRLLPLAMVAGVGVPVYLAASGAGARILSSGDAANSVCCVLSVRSIHEAVEARLLAMPGGHVVVVDTGPRARGRAGDVRFTQVLVYNQADVAAARVIWLNADPALNPDTFRRYPGRTLWRLDWRADGSPWLHPYVGLREARGAGGAALAGGAAAAGGPT